jgi:carbonic anhydrase
VAVLFRLGKENAALGPVFDRLPSEAGESRTLDAGFDPSSLLPADRRYFRFMGSLTTPPCSEEVLWNVLSTPVELSAPQLAAFRKRFEMNARPVQPLNGRKVILGP